MSFQEMLKDFVHIEGGRNLPNDRFTRNEMMTIDKIAGYRKKNNNEGIYLSAYIYDNLDLKEASLYADFYLDFDAEGQFDLARNDALAAINYLRQSFTYNIPEEYIRIYFSGMKGIHLIVPGVVLGVEPDKHLNEYFKTMATTIEGETKNGTLDLAIYDRRRLFRIANSKHMKTGLFKVPLTYLELATASIEEIYEIAKKPRQIKYAPVIEVSRAHQEYVAQIEKWNDRLGKKFDTKRRFKTKPLDFTPACIQELIDSGPIQGNRNLTASVLTSFWKRQGSSEQEVWDNLIKWNEDSIAHWELKNTMESILKGDYEYGCSTLESLATCIGEKCPLYRKPEGGSNK